MKEIYSRLVLTFMFGASSAVAHESISLEEAFTQGELSTSIGWYAQSIDAKGGEKDSGFSNGFAEVGFETAAMYGVSLGIKGFGSVKTSEENDGDYKNTMEDDAVLSEAYLKIAHEGMGKIVVGRQAVEYNWLGDYIDGVTAQLDAIDQVVLSVAWARRYAVVGFDEISETFSKVNGNDGVYMMDLKYTPIEVLEINPYFYYSQDVFSAYGAKVSVNYALNDEWKSKTMAHYVDVQSDLSGTPNGSFAQGEQGFEVAGAVVAVGYMKVDKNGMVNSFVNADIYGLGDFGDTSPFEEGNHVFAPDAKTPYVRVEYEINGVKLAGIYGKTRYFDEDAIKKLSEKEWNVSVSYAWTKPFETTLLYVDVDNDDATQSYQGVKVMARYTF